MINFSDRKKYEKNANVLKIILDFLFELIYLYVTTFFSICQQKDYDIIRQIATDVSIPTISAINAATNTNLIFLIPTALVYNAIV